MMTRITIPTIGPDAEAGTKINNYVKNVKKIKFNVSYYVQSSLISIQLDNMQKY